MSELALKRVIHWGCLCAALVGCAAPVQAVEDDDEPKWVESAFSLPAPPKGGDLLSFEVSRQNHNTFYVDSRSLSIGEDGVLRYTLIVESPSGVRNISYEGMRCSTVERRVYAYATADGGWRPARQSVWQAVRGNSLNRQYAALFSEYFCVPGHEVTSPAAAISILRRGGVPAMTP